MTIVIFGPMATGKTYHASRFLQHYGCARIVEADPRVREPIRDDDLILTNQSYVDAKHRFSEARIVPVDEARIAIGLNPAPNGGFRPPYDQAPGWITPARSDGPKPVDPLLLAIEQFSFASHVLAQRALYGGNENSYNIDELACDLAASVAWVFRTTCDKLTEDADADDDAKRSILKTLIEPLEAASSAIYRINDAAAQRWIDSQSVAV